MEFFTVTGLRSERKNGLLKLAHCLRLEVQTISQTKKNRGEKNEHAQGSVTGTSGSHCIRLRSQQR
jgi:hypothetical protein